jgi:hypothetical protein
MSSFGLALFASLGGVLYGYNQGVFSSVQVMQSFKNRYPPFVSLHLILARGIMWPVGLRLTGDRLRSLPLVPPPRV